ncbi:hypothetical protein [Streptomyces sp. NBC_00829]|uniref:hypothetical protein n=1 Tax=Streptomyces sp. NBC_00829 TaxID=2903679 RepID=UPI00386A5FBA|nr:hypothetical protein OG293_38480 [Streptomyces sp. NBC_00829]
MSPADLAVDAGRCWLDLDRLQQADVALADGLILLDPALERTCSVVLAYRAEAALARHDLTAAAADARDALDTARGTQATRCIDLVNSTLSKLAPHRTHPAVASLYDAAR